MFFFRHPIFKLYACNAHGDIFALHRPDIPRIKSWDNKITISHLISGKLYPIQYSHSKFQKEALGYNITEDDIDYESDNQENYEDLLYMNEYIGSDSE